MEIKTTIEILNDNEILSDEYDYLYQRIENTDNIKWVRVDDVIKYIELHRGYWDIDDFHFHSDSEGEDLLVNELLVELRSKK
jgi:hypothetical protein